MGSLVMICFDSVDNFQLLLFDFFNIFEELLWSHSIHDISTYTVIRAIIEVQYQQTDSNKDGHFG